MTRSTFRHPLAVLLFALAVTGCAAGPHLTPDVEGVGGLASQEMEVPDRPDTSQLPMLYMDCEGIAEADCISGRPAYRLGARDEVSISLWGRPDLGSQMHADIGSQAASEVSLAGTISLPFLEPVQVAGRSLSEVRQQVDGLYRGVLEERPQVDVKILSCSSLHVDVSGEVARPGAYSICDDLMTVGEVLNRAGGLTNDANFGRGVLVRDGVPFLLNYRQPVASTASDVLLEAGDKIHFPSLREQVIYVFGEVENQGVFQIPGKGKDVLAALAEAGGADVVTGRARKFYLIRPSSNGRTVYEIDMGELLVGPPIALVDGDRLFVPPTSLATWNRWWRQFLPSILYRGVNEIY